MSQFVDLEIILAHLQGVAKGREQIDEFLIKTAISKFEKSSRPKELGKEISRAAQKIITHNKKYIQKLLQNETNIFGHLYDVATFMRWKTLDDLNSTAQEILENVINPVNKLIFPKKFEKPRHKNLERIAFIPTANLFPRNYKNANQTGAYGLIESFIAAKKQPLQS